MDILNGMKMFDTVICEYPLPLPEEAKVLKSAPDWSKVEFHTTSIPVSRDDLFAGHFVENYTIEDDGQIYKDSLKRELMTNEDGESFVDEIDDGIEKVNYTGELIFYAMHLEEEYDIQVEFSALFWKGELKEIKLVEWEKVDNSARKETKDKITNLVKKKQAEQNSTLYKIKEFIKTPVRWLFYVIKFLVGLMARVIWWLERKIT
tara:strand:+ start:19249 stop:19863 length:615 start_codon:yes stop_codon:yes gene_type:complete